MSKVELTGIKYIGLDYSEEHIRAAKYRHSGLDFRVSDIITDELPAADLMLCRDFMQHLPNDLVFEFIRNIKNVKWLLATSHDNDKNDDINEAGDFRPLNLMAAPFLFPKPERTIPDGRGRILGLWKWA